jgi:hypothetical protein
MRSHQRGSLVVASLLLSSIILLVGLGFLGKRRAQYRAAQSQRFEMAALSLAEAGLEDARVKLLKDPGFPHWQEGQSNFSYRETFASGDYQVVLTRYPKEQLVPGEARYLNEFLVIDVEGSAGDSGEPQARRRMQAEMMTRGLISSVKDLGTY